MKNSIIGTLLDVNENGVLHVVDLDNAVIELKTSLSSKKYKVYVVDENSTIHNKSDLMEAFYNQCELPDYFGANWDALGECVKDYTFAPAKGYFFLILDYKQLKHAIGQGGLNILVEIFNSASLKWKNLGIPFKLILNEKTLIASAS